MSEYTLIFLDLCSLQIKYIMMYYFELYCCISRGLPPAIWAGALIAIRYLVVILK